MLTIASWVVCTRAELGTDTSACVEGIQKATEEASELQAELKHVQEQKKLEALDSRCVQPP